MLSEKVVRPHDLSHRPISFSSAPVTEGIEIRQVRAFGKLLGIGRFLPCSVGMHFSRLRHLGWEQRSLPGQPLGSMWTPWVP